ncbi:hypothetical protein P3T73_16175 [Kiritimatiellota bacterium B12222]|nr:hypothetical protein P3T73_16175 [Kiritimatiellota bacterium B12222]
MPSPHSESDPIQILGFMLVKNEDRFVATALRNALPLCDRFIVLDNQSSDHTRQQLDLVAQETSASHLEIIDLEDVQTSQSYLEPYYGKKWWVFAVDGDEIYDPTGLTELRAGLQAGNHQDVWQVFGHVLHVTHWHQRNATVRGYQSPPARPMTKLYNFSFIESWTDCPERLHGGTLTFKSDIDAQKSRYVYFEHCSWEDSPFRCLHMVFMRRSSQKNTFQYRNTPTEELNSSLFSQSWLAHLKYTLYQQVRVIRKKTGKDRAYRKGPHLLRDAHPFHISEYR